MSWNPFASSTNAAPATGGSGSWMNMETAQVRAVASGDLTGEASAFEALGFKFSRQERIIGFVSWWEREDEEVRNASDLLSIFLIAPL
jgi:hypothetical protein